MMLKMAQRLLRKVLVSFLPLFSPQGGGDIPGNSVGLCRPVLQILTL